MSKSSQLAFNLGLWLFAIILTYLLKVVENIGWGFLAFFIAIIVLLAIGAKYAVREIIAAKKQSDLEKNLINKTMTTQLSDEEIEAMDPVNQRFIKAWRDKKNLEKK